MSDSGQRAKPLEERKERIYLTGFMASGKSTIGPIVANVIGYDFVDIDRAIEQAVGKSVNQIFLESGEDHFRTLERELVASLSKKPNHVISLGGGTIMDDENFRIVTTSGILVYLKSTPERIFRRVQRRDDRPVLRSAGGDRLSDEQLRTRIETLYRVREPVYAKADFTFHTDDKRLGLTVDEIVRILSHIIG